MPSRTTPTKTIELPKPYPHGIAVHDGLDRLLVTSTVRPSDLGDAGETITVIEASSGKGHVHPQSVHQSFSLR